MREWIEVPEISTGRGESVGYEPAPGDWHEDGSGWRDLCGAAPNEPWNRHRGWMKVTLTRSDPDAWVRELAKRIEREHDKIQQMALL